MLTCFNDADSRLRYYACEALYNIVKVARGAVLPHFNVLFDGLSKVTAPAAAGPARGTPGAPSPGCGQSRETQACRRRSSVQSRHHCLLWPCTDV